MCRYSEVKDSSRASLTSVWKLRRLIFFAQETYGCNKPHTRHVSLSQWKEDELFQEPRGSGSRDGSESHRLWDPVPLRRHPFSQLLLYLQKKKLQTPAATLEHRDALLELSAQPSSLVSLNQSSLSMYSSQMWIILGVNVNALIMAVLTRSTIQDAHWIHIRKYLGLL